jgi:hypothetical protein
MLIKKHYKSLELRIYLFIHLTPESKPVHPFFFNPDRPHFPYLLMTQDLLICPVITLDTVNV